MEITDERPFICRTCLRGTDSFLWTIFREKSGSVMMSRGFLADSLSTVQYCIPRSLREAREHSSLANTKRQTCTRSALR